MKLAWMICASAVLTAGAALAQMDTMTTTTTTTMVTTTPQRIVCPTGSFLYPTPCAAIEAQTITGDDVVLVLGQEEQYALDNLDIDDLNWRGVGINNPSLFTPGNPLTYTRINPVITRQGNPFYPYYPLSGSVRVAGTEETVTVPTVPGDLPPEIRTSLENVANRYRGMTTQQAMALGYQPMGACIEGVGVVYVNQSLIDNRFDPMMPEAFTFSSDGQLLAAHYILLSDVPFSAFGQMMQPSPLVQGALQLPVWLFTENESGMFVLQNPDDVCE